MQITLANETLHLLPERALFWPRERALIVADLHIGKDDVFRARGIPIPRGAMDETFARLSAAMERALQCAKVPTAQLFVLGDFLHARESANASTFEAFTRWRDAHPDLSITVIEGNHDRHAGTASLAEQWGLRMEAEPFALSPFAFRHEADGERSLPCEPGSVEVEVSPYELAGHVHPCTVLSSKVDRLRVPCFVFGEHAALLPAFGAFTGGHVVTPSANETVYAIAGEKVLRVPTAQVSAKA